MACRWWVLSLVSLVWLGREFERETEELRRRGSERFVKCFTIDFLVKYFTSFYAQTLVKLKIFYMQTNT